MRARLLILGCFAHDPQSVLTAVREFALVRVELLLNFGFIGRSERSHSGKLHVAVFADAELWSFAHDPQFSLCHLLTPLLILALAGEEEFLVCLGDVLVKFLDQESAIFLRTAPEGGRKYRVTFRAPPNHRDAANFSFFDQRCHTPSLRRPRWRSSPVEIKRHHYPLSKLRKSWVYSI
jgi:hypothetical protein